MLAALRQVAFRIRAFVRAAEFDRDFQHELDAHVAMLTENNIRRGLTADEARRAAILRTGSPGSLQAQHREARGLPFLETLLQDLRFAARLFAKDRWFTAAAVAALGLGIGANATGFTIVNAVFLRELPFEDADRLLVVSWLNTSNRRVSVSHAELQDWRTITNTFSGLAGYSEGQVNISDARTLPEQTNAARVTTDLFRLLRQPPALGRDFLESDAHAGADPVVIVSHSFWRTRYFSDPGILGHILRVNGRPATIVGVMPEGVSFPDRVAIWMPFVPTAAQSTRTARVFRVFGRLVDNATLRGAQAEFASIAQQLTAAHPDDTKGLRSIRVETFADRFIGGAARPMFMTVMGAVTFVLLIACANVANMLLSRSAHRAREVALRTAMGATRWRVIRQLLLESTLLSVWGGAVGLVLAVWGVRLFALAMSTSGLPGWVVFEFDGVVFAYVALISIVTATLFGLTPALQVSHANANVLLQEGGRSHTGGRRTRWFAGTMVVAQLALAAVLLTGAGVMIRSFLTLYTTDLGLPVDRLMAMAVQLPESKYGSGEARRAFFDELEPRLAAIPGLEAVSITTGVPPDDGGERLVETEELAVDAPRIFVGTVTVSPHFFDVLGVPIARGRKFDDRDGARGIETVIVNDRFAAQFFPGELCQRFYANEAGQGCSCDTVLNTDD